MSNEWQPGQLLFAGFEGTELPGQLGDLVGAGQVGGVILFTRNLRDPHQIRRLVRQIRERDEAVTIAIDQEGGRVQRLRKPWTEWPPMRKLGEIGSTDLTAEVAAALAVQLTELGIGMDFAPVVDVDTNPNNPVINDRSFSREPAKVAAHAVAFIERMQSLGVAACAKHFPGHGDTAQDSHLQLPSLPHDLDRVREVELVPFVAAAKAGVASIMTAHVVFEAIDRKRPATLSPEVMALLREEIGYDGLVFSDDLEMKAVADHFSPRQLVSGALDAGVDALLVCKEIDLVLEVLRLLESSPDAAVEHPLRRMVALKGKLPPPPVPPLDTPRPPYPDHDALAERVRRE
jgi:beta-N-acetylhexosaminidase